MNKLTPEIPYGSLPFLRPTSRTSIAGNATTITPPSYSSYNIWWGSLAGIYIGQKKGRRYA